MTNPLDLLFFTPQEVADFFRVSRATVYRWIDEGRLKACKPLGRTCGHLRITREQVMEFSLQNWED